jgi:nucleotide-binding universal stress UspA family protein
MDKIVCATDLSPASRPIVAAAGALARALSWPVELYHVVQAPPEPPPQLLTEADMIGELYRSAEAMIAEQAACLAACGVAVTTTIEIGLGRGIVRHASDVDAGLLVLGTHARRGAARFFLGSVAERTIQHAPCPVLVVPPRASGRLVAAPSAPGPMKVLVGVDFSRASDAALDWLHTFQLRVPCDARLIHLYAPPSEHQRLGVEPPEPFEASPEVVTVLARDLRAHVQRRLGMNAAVRIRPSWGDDGTSPAWEAETDDADLLVIGASQTRRSAALATVRGSRVPVLCVPEATLAPVETALAPVRAVLVPTDFSAGGNAAVAAACRLLLAGGGDIVLAHVARPDGPGLDPDRQNELETCLLGLLPSDLDTKAVHARTFVTADKSPATAIVQAVWRFAPDVVVMSAHGHANVRPDHRAPTTDHVMRHSPKPVMVVPAASER